MRELVGRSAVWRERERAAVVHGASGRVLCLVLERTSARVGLDRANQRETPLPSLLLLLLSTKPMRAEERALTNAHVQTCRRQCLSTRSKRSRQRHQSSWRRRCTRSCSRAYAGARLSPLLLVAGECSWHCTDTVAFSCCAVSCLLLQLRDNPSVATDDRAPLWRLIAVPVCAHGAQPRTRIAYKGRRPRRQGTAHEHLVSSYWCKRHTSEAANVRVLHEPRTKCASKRFASGRTTCC